MSKWIFSYYVVVLISTIIVNSMGYDASTWQNWALVFSNIACCIFGYFHGYGVGYHRKESEVSKKWN